MKRILIPALPLMPLLASRALAEEEAATGIDMTQPAPIGTSLLITLLGMATVLLGLTILIFLIKLLVKATDGMGKKKKKADAAPQPVIPPMKAFTIRSDEDEPAADDALVAAITAALMCVMEGSDGFVVRRIRRV